MKYSQQKHESFLMVVYLFKCSTIQKFGVRKIFQMLFERNLFPCGHQGSIYLGKNNSKTVVLWNIIAI